MQEMPGQWESSSARGIQPGDDGPPPGLQLQPPQLRQHADFLFRPLYGQRHFLHSDPGWGEKVSCNIMILNIFNGNLSNDRVSYNNPYKYHTGTP